MAKHILVIDDSATITLLWEAILGKWGYAASYANGGASALAMLAVGNYDFLIVDYHMEDMDGLELTARIRAMPAYTLIPIVMITADHNEELRESARMAGINAWMTKPVKPDTLLKIITQLCPSDDVVN